MIIAESFEQQGRVVRLIKGALQGWQVQCIITDLACHYSYGGRTTFLATFFTLEDAISCYDSCVADFVIR